MEAFAAVSLAGNILQFIHTIKELVWTGHEVLDSGAKHGNIDLEVIVKDLRSQSARLKEIALRSPNTGRNLDKLVSRCEAVTKDIQDVLDRLRLRPDSGKWASLLQALKSQW